MNIPETIIPQMSFIADKPPPLKEEGNFFRRSFLNDLMIHHHASLPYSAMSTS